MGVGRGGERPQARRLLALPACPHPGALHTCLETLPSAWTPPALTRRGVRRGEHGARTCLEGQRVEAQRALSTPLGPGHDALQVVAVPAARGMVQLLSTLNYAQRGEDGGGQGGDPPILKEARLVGAATIPF